jgi:TonB family protein
MRFPAFRASFVAIILTLATGAFAQTPLDEAVRRADVSAAWPGCDPLMTECTKTRLAEFIQANLQMPPEAKAAGTGGLVLVEFVVEKNGLIGEIRPVKDPGMGLAKEAVRVIQLMKDRKMKWVPAENGGKRIAFRYTVPVSFNLDAPAKEKPAKEDGTKAPADGVYVVAEVMPKFAGCASDTLQDCTFRKLLEHIKGNMKYPDEAIKQNIQGQVVTEFVIGADGEVTDAKVKTGLGHGCDEEALRVLGLMPAWTPGYQDGKAVPVRMTLPILFQLPKAKE